MELEDILTDEEVPTAKNVKKAAKAFGADFVCIGSIERWDSAPKENDPRSIMPRCKSVICLGFRIHRGAQNAVREGTYYSGYTFSGFNDLNEAVAPLVQHRLASYLEDFGYETIALAHHSNKLGDGSGEAKQNPDGTFKPKPEVFINYRISAVLCGAGEIGYSRLLLTPHFGPCQRIYFLLTEVELEPDPIFEGKLCDGCKLCVRKCPAKALSLTETDDFEIPGICNIHRSSLDMGKCAMSHGGGAFSPFAPPEVRAYAENIANGTRTTCADGTPRPSPEEISKNVGEKVPYAVIARKNWGIPAATCAECQRACLEHLDKRGRLSLKFRHKYGE